jgi:replicative DNA helicase
VVESLVLGHIILINNNDIVRVSERHFTGEYLYVYKQMKKLHDLGKPIDALHLMDNGVSAKIIQECTDVSSLTICNEHHFSKIKEESETRLVKEYVSNLITKKDINAVKAASDILDLTEKNETQDDHIDQVIDSFMLEIKKPRAETDYNYKFDGGLTFLNTIIGSARKGELLLVGARSGVGKTLFVMQNLSAWSKGLKTLFVSREMRGESLWKRILVRETGIPNESFRDKQLEPDHWESINRINSMFKGRELYLNSKISTISEIKRRLYETKAEMLIVDYLQIMDVEESMHSREREVAHLSRQLKKIANDFNIPVIVLSQLNDNAGEHRPSGERDIRESKAPFQDADNVIFLHKPTLEETKKWVERGYIDESKLDSWDLIEINIVKQRDGIVGMNLCRHIKKQLRFVEIKRIKG